MRFLFAIIVMVMILFKGATLSSLNAPNNQNQIPFPPKVCDKVPVNNCNCHCNLHQDPRIGQAIKTLEAKMERLITMVNRTSTLQPFPQPATFVSSCREQYEKDNTSKSQVYPLRFGSQMVPVYCHMGDFGCGDGGWTLAMKTDGTKRTFHFDSNLWRDRLAYNLKGGETGFDNQETKLPSYWNTPFSKICLGMRIGLQVKFVVINKQANSLFSLIADGHYRNISLGRNTWKSLIGPTASLQTNCDSRIGFGTGGRLDDSNTCGNDADATGDNGEKHQRRFFFLVKFNRFNSHICE